MLIRAEPPYPFTKKTTTVQQSTKKLEKEMKCNPIQPIEICLAHYIANRRKTKDRVL
jgi:hypothetical protein